MFRKYTGDPKDSKTGCTALILSIVIKPLVLTNQVYPHQDYLTIL